MPRKPGSRGIQTKGAPPSEAVELASQARAVSLGPRAGLQDASDTGSNDLKTAALPFQEVLSAPLKSLCRPLGFKYHLKYF